MDDFTYRGDPIKKLLALCDYNLINPGKCGRLFGIAEQYSQGKIYREYANFPEDLPLNIYSDHGINVEHLICPHELHNRAYAMLTYTDQRYENFIKVSKKPCYKVPHPLMWYRNQHNIQQDENAQGTIFFAAHSTPDVSVDYDIEWICNRLREFPEEMQPVNVCLFMSDVHNGTFLKYMEQGFPVYTAGNVSDINFVDRFYDLLRHYKYAASNSYGTYIYYCIEMGIPFSIIRQPVEFMNYTDRNCAVGKMDIPLKMIQAEELFEGINLTITKQQSNFVNYTTKVTNYLSPQELNDVFYKALEALK